LFGFGADGINGGAVSIAPCDQREQIKEQIETAGAVSGLIAGTCYPLESPKMRGVKGLEYPLHKPHKTKRITAHLCPHSPNYNSPYTHIQNKKGGIRPHSIFPTIHIGFVAAFFQFNQKNVAVLNSHIYLCITINNTDTAVLQCCHDVYLTGGQSDMYHSIIGVLFYILLFLLITYKTKLP
jgi:hypothetical protein